MSSAFRGRGMARKRGVGWSTAGVRDDLATVSRGVGGGAWFHLSGSHRELSGAKLDCERGVHGSKRGTRAREKGTRREGCDPGQVAQRKCLGEMNIVSH